MVIDASVVVAILLDEPESEHFARLIEGDSARLMSAMSYYEASVILKRRRGAQGVQSLDALIRETQIRIVSFDEEQVLVARQAYDRYGKGLHPAGLNIGDCASYALASSMGEALLFKGADFARTDVLSAET